MVSRIFVIVALLLAVVGRAEACKYVARPVEGSVAASATAFVGSVRTVENGLVILNVEKAIRGAKDGDEFDTDLHPDKGDCGIVFKPGERWLYLGNDATSGSLLLQDEFGRLQADNLAAAKKLAPGIADDGSDVQSGTSTVMCMKNSGDQRESRTSAGIAIRLDNGVSATVKADPDEFNCPNEVHSYTAGGKGEATIVVCPKSSGDQNLPCQSRPGTVTISGAPDGGSLTGQIRTEEGEYHQTFVFRVKRLKDEAQCDVRSARSGGCGPNTQ